MTSGDICLSSNLQVAVAPHQLYHFSCREDGASEDDVRGTKRALIPREARRRVAALLAMAIAWAGDWHLWMLLSLT